VAGDQNVHTSLDHLIDCAGSEIDGGDSVRIGDHELFAVGRVGVLVEIERRGAVFTGKANHAMSGVGIGPFRWEGSLRRQHAHGECQKYQIAHHRS